MSYWGYCVLYVVYLINLTLTPLLQSKPPFEVLFHKIRSYKESFRVFGCLVFSSTNTQNHSKSDPRGKPYIFLGFQPGFKGYLLLHFYTHHVHVSKNVHFMKHIFLSFHNFLHHTFSLPTKFQQ